MKYDPYCPVSAQELAEPEWGPAFTVVNDDVEFGLIWDRSPMQEPDWCVVELPSQAMAYAADEAYGLTFSHDEELDASDYPGLSPWDDDCLPIPAKHALRGGCGRSLKYESDAYRKRHAKKHRAALIAIAKKATAERMLTLERTATLAAQGGYDGNGGLPVTFADVTSASARFGQDWRAIVADKD